tara:strand:- start:22945 stop:23409 length:465 start_codon:yes stop_codon:yes gene_type:complete
MIDSEKVKELTEEAIATEEGFLIDLKISADAKIKILVDHLEGMSVEMLMRISRHVEHNLDREENDFAIEVSSPGIDVPFSVNQQYTKNIGRPVIITLLDESKKSGDLIKFENEEVTIKWTEKVPKPVGKGKMKVDREEVIPLKEIKETILELRF